jgi:hypothetical protein
MTVPLRVPRSVLVLTALLCLPGPAPAASGVPEHAFEDPTGAAFPAAPWPRFTLFGWVSPPAWCTTPARYVELAGAGFNVTLPAWADSGSAPENLERLEYTRPLGVRNLLLDNDLDSVGTGDPRALARADSIVARYRDDPAFLGWYLGDEPPIETFPRLGEWFQILRARDPKHPAWNNLAPRNAFAVLEDFHRYLESYCLATHPAVLSNSHYDFGLEGDGLELTENISTLSAVAREHGVPFWGIVQLTEHGQFRQMTEGLLRWQVAQWLAWGTRGIGYFTYWTPGPDSYYNWQPAMIDWFTGEPTANYGMVRRVNAHLAPIGNTLAGMTWTAAQHAGSVPPGGVPFAPDSAIAGLDGRATLGRYQDSTGVACVLVGNSDSLSAQTILLRGGELFRFSRLREDASGWDPVRRLLDGRISLTLAPGDFALLKAERTTAPPSSVDPPRESAAAPRLELLPNPANGSVRLLVSGVRAAGRVSVTDLAGRVVWSRPVAAGAGSVTWQGVRDDGGRAGAGIYFARLESGAGRVVRRLAWLGPR